MSSGDAGTGGPPRPRFAKPAWAQSFTKSSVTATTGSDSLFARSRDTFQELLDEDASPLDNVLLSPTGPNLTSGIASVFRPNSDGNDDIVNQHGADRETEIRPKKRSTAELLSDDESNRLAPSYKRSTSSSFRPSTSYDNTISLDSDDDTLEIHSTAPYVPTITQTPQTRATAVLDDSDDELQEIRERIRKSRQLQLSRTESATANGGSDLANGTGPSTNTDPRDAPDVVFTSAIQKDSLNPTSAEDVVDILITSEIPATSALIIRRGVNQRLQEVREAWCRAQNFPPNIEALVILTYKSRRVFDIQKCSNLDIPILKSQDDDGTNKTGEDADSGITEDGHIRIRMQAMTRQEYDELRAKEARRRMGEEDETDADDASKGGASIANDPTPGGADPESSSLIPAPAETGAIRLILRSKDYDDFKLVVKQETTIEACIAAFCHKNNLTGDRAASVRLVLDGESLALDSTIEDSDLEDMDTLEVHYAATAQVQAAAAAAVANRQATEARTVTITDDQSPYDDDDDDDSDISEGEAAYRRNEHGGVPPQLPPPYRGRSARAGRARGRGRGRGTWVMARAGRGRGRGRGG